MSTETDNPVFDTFAIVEMMGHVRMAGRLTEEQRFGSVIGRCDVPTDMGVRTCDHCDGSGDNVPRNPDGLPCLICNGTGTLGGGFTTVYFTAASLFRLTPCSEAVARGVAAHSRVEPAHRYELPAPGILSRRRDSFEDSDDRGEYDDEELRS